MPGRRRKKVKKSKGGPPDIPVSSFSDIAFLLIVFFIVATTLEQMTGVVTDIPAGEKSQEQTDKTPTVQIHGDKVTFNERTMDINGLRGELRGLRLHSKKGEAKIVLLEAKGDVSYQTYFAAMTAISAGGGMIAIVKEDDGE